MRTDYREHNQIRPVTIQYDIQPDAAGSILIKIGNTQVLCAVTLEESVPPFLKNTGKGWLTAEYGMLPCATSSRNKREAARGRTGRTYEIQRLIGRSLRMMVDLDKLGENTLRIDCDVLVADGGTRTASITGAAIAVKQAVKKLSSSGKIPADIIKTQIAAISAGLVSGKGLLDLDYSEDSKAEADANFVMDFNGKWIEIQSSAEGRPFSGEEFKSLMELAEQGINQLKAASK
jgi:ribonuclease PH